MVLQILKLKGRRLAILSLLTFIGPFLYSQTLNSLNSAFDSLDVFIQKDFKKGASYIYMDCYADTIFFKIATIDNGVLYKSIKQSAKMFYHNGIPIVTVLPNLVVRRRIRDGVYRQIFVNSKVAIQLFYDISTGKLTAYTEQ